MSKAKLIVLEGMDGSGTTTQVKALSEYLTAQGYKVFTSSEPTSGPLGQFIRQTLVQPINNEPKLLSMLALCFAADRLHHIHYTIEPALKNYDFVLLDRYVLSSLVYQGLHHPKSFVEEINRYAIKPDLTVILDIDVKTSVARLQERTKTRDFFETQELLEKIHKEYLWWGKRSGKDMVLIDGRGSKEEVLRHIVNVVFV